MENFSELNLPTPLVNALVAMKYDTPTPIQAQAIPFALEGKDVLGSAQTGTGKTAAFAIPLIAKLLRSDTSTGLVLAPTRELAMQVMALIEQLLGKNSQIRAALLIGGEPIAKQFFQLKKHPRIIVGTPGRINDHLQRRSLNLKNSDFLVLDEMDRMLDMGFGIQIDDIVKHLPVVKQTVMFSATVPKAIEKIAAKYLVTPERVSVGSTHSPAENIKQEFVEIAQTAKYDRLIEELEKRQGSVIIFVKTKRNTEALSKKLNAAKYRAVAIHGDLRQHQRARAIKSFRDEHHRIMVATDVAARGLDIPHIEHVINYDLPGCPEDYIHRIGRTARAGAKGEALSFISGEDRKKYQAIKTLLNGGEAKNDNHRGGGQHKGGKKPFGREFKGKSRNNNFGKKPFGGARKSFGNKQSGNR
jgi:superfamily II DNA/RNA helicase